MGKIVLIIIGIAVLAFVGWIVLAFIPQDTGLPDMPKQNKAEFSVYIKNTGGLLFTDDYEQHGQDVGSRIFILHTFWEMRGKDFKFIESDIILDENIFGEITIKRRAK